LKIVVINQPMDMLLPPHQNSIGIWTYKIAPHLARDHDLLVVGKKSGAQRDGVERDGARYDFAPRVVPNRAVIRGLDRLSDQTGRHRLPSYASRLAYLDYALQSAWRARSFQADIVHIHNFSQFVPTVHRLRPQARIVLHMACEWLNQLDYGVIDKRLSQVDLVVGCSEYITEKVAKRFPHHAERCATVHNGVDVDRFQPGPTAGNGTGSTSPAGDTATKRVLFVGRVSPEKGVHDLIDAFTLVAREVPNAVLDVAGPLDSLPREFIVDVTDDPEIGELDRFYGATDYLTALRDRIPAQLRERVRFLGGVPQDELVALYNQADVLVNPSYSEAFGMSLVEALACETPVIASRVGGMVEIVGHDESVGLLYERGDVDGLAGSLVRLLSDDKYRASAGRTGRDHVRRRFGWGPVSRSLVHEYEELWIRDAG
jgi:glycosyltransferase involved in cell wall biosynthesis